MTDFDYLCYHKIKFVTMNYRIITLTFFRKLTLNLKNSSSVKKNIINKRYGLSCDECEVSMEGASDIKQDVL